MSTLAPPSAALTVTVRGVVQGVGFRPFVHRLAARDGLAGWVRNEPGGVVIAVEGPREGLDRFVDAVRREAPPLARIRDVQVAPAEPHGHRGFTIMPSVVHRAGRLPVSPDVATCDTCEAELRDPANRRFGHPFITCTDCGPRYTVIEGMPYDRARTSMARFAPCPACEAEYGNPASRRYHSQTNSCPGCGPRLWLEETGRPLGLEGADAIADAARRLAAGEIVAVRGLGGFQLAVDATSAPAVERLRRRKGREAKPLAVMVATVADAARLGVVGAVERTLLAGAARPIVLLRRRRGAGLAEPVAPGLDTVGVMLPATPLHHVLLARTGRPLVMTSGNLSDEPIAITLREARERLGVVADALLVHDREIVARYDDSVLRVADGAPLFLRRARGYAPLPAGLPVPTPLPLVAVGPHLKNTFCLAQDGDAYVSQHIGDLESIESLDHFRTTLQQYRRLFRITPRVAVRDLHPGYLSTRIADQLGLEQTIAVQHHHAHLAAVAAEHGRTDRVVALAFDGTGYGTDGCVWGAEVLAGDLAECERLAQLRYAPLPGGDLAARQPWRAALGYRSLAPDLAPDFALAFASVREQERALAERQIARRLNAPLASSMGRLFDAAAAVLGIRRRAAYEAQAAMELEALAGGRTGPDLPFPLDDTTAPWQLDPVPLLAALGAAARQGRDVADLAASFHTAVARSAARVARRAADTAGVATVVLCGGVFQNARLLRETRAMLETAGIEVLVPRLFSPNDGAISYGQAAVAAARLARIPGGG